MLFSKRLTPAPPLVLCLEATIQGQGPSFQAELIPVRSPLLRESYLVPFPPLTYMLKFSGFADLTSCCAWDKLRAVGWSAARICNKGVMQAHKLQKLQLSSNTPACATRSTRKRSHGTQRRR
jgi:hypothetical protein